MWFHFGPSPVALGVLRAVEIDQRAAVLDVVELGLVDSGMLLRPVHGLDPDRAHCHAERAHHDEDVAPAVIMRDPAHQRCEDHGREILPGVEEGRRSAALIAREPGRHDARIGRKRRRFGKSHQEPQPEQHDHGGARGEEADPALHHREQRPDDDAERVDRARAIAVEQPSARHLRDHIGPAKGREHVAHCNRIEVEFLGERGAGDRERGAVGVIDGRDQEQHGHDEYADA